MSPSYQKQERRALHTLNSKDLSVSHLETLFLETVEKPLGNYINTNPYHHIYRIGKYAETVLVELTGRMQNTLSSKETVMCAFAHIKDTFDNIAYEDIKKALINRGVYGVLFR